MDTTITTATTTSADISESVKVYCRIRPPLPNEIRDDSVPAIKVDSLNSIVSYGHGKDGVSSVRMNAVFNQNNGELTADKSLVTEQEEIYRTIAKPIVDSALCGYSGTIMAYGPTNSGKTYSMRGTDNDELHYGIMPRCIKQLLASKTSTDVIYMSYVQIYCELVTDLLWNFQGFDQETDGGSNSTGAVAVTSNNSSNGSVESVIDSMNRNNTTQPQLYIREHNGKVFIQGVSRYLLTSMDDFFRVMKIGDKSRATATTNLNETSSRSHAVMIISISSSAAAAAAAGAGGSTGAGVGGGNAAATVAATAVKQTIVTQPMVNESTLMLVDLAGSERASATANKGYLRSEEAKAINLSLSALGNCISALCEKKTHIPYRDSKLTRLLQSSLGGGARTALLTTLPPTDTRVQMESDSAESPVLNQYSEVVSALKFAARASKIEVVAKVLRFIDYEKLYQELLIKMDTVQDSEFTYKKELMHKQMRLSSLETEVAKLKDELAATQVQLREALSATPAAAPDSDSSAIAGGGTVAMEQTGSSFVNSRRNSRDLLSSDTSTSSATIHALQAQLQSLQTKHRAEIHDMKNIHAGIVAAFKRKESDLQVELISAAEDLQKERCNHLDTLRDLTASKQRCREQDCAMNARTSDYISELTEKQNRIETLEAQTVALKGRLLKRTTNMDDEEDDADQEREETVPKSKVLEMETLFMDAINRMSERVIQLEAQAAQAQQQAVKSSSSSNGGVGNGRGSSENDWLNDDSDFVGANINNSSSNSNNSVPTKAYTIRGGPAGAGSGAIGYGAGGGTGGYGSSTTNKSGARRQPAVPSYSLGASTSTSALFHQQSQQSSSGNSSRIEPGRIRAPNKLNI